MVRPLSQRRCEGAPSVSEEICEGAPAVSDEICEGAPSVSEEICKGAPSVSEEIYDGAPCEPKLLISLAVSFQKGTTEDAASIPEEIIKGAPFVREIKESVPLPWLWLSLARRDTNISSFMSVYNAACTVFLSVELELNARNLLIVLGGSDMILQQAL